MRAVMGPPDRRRMPTEDARGEVRHPSEFRVDGADADVLSLPTKVNGTSTTMR